AVRSLCRGERCTYVLNSGIDCGGHYVSDCAVSILVETGSGHREVINSQRFNGYPLSAALDKALDDAAGKIRINAELLDYLVSS
ncbi:hypothetical protein, partial [Pseudomonas aeruginosa]|uniref:hypothetical protein n=1 Tax=Pseudomonas aeruginosa TaxID=287 RepID=UPI0018922856